MGSASAPPAGTLSRSATASGVLGALIASSCCVPPAAAVALGTSLATAAALSELLAYRPIFVAAGLGVFGLIFWTSLRAVAKGCAVDARKRLTDRGLTIGLLSFAGVYLAVNQLLVPLLYNLRWLI